MNAITFELTPVAVSEQGVRELSLNEIDQVAGGDCGFLQTAAVVAGGAAIGAATVGFAGMVGGFIVGGPKGAVAGAVGGAAVGAATGGFGALVGYQAGCTVG